MVNKSAAWLSNVFLKRGWIEQDDLDWCLYALEKRLGLLLHFAAVAFWVGFSGLFTETLSFCVPLYFLRRRMGGIHAKSAFVCFFVSICLVILSSAFWGEMLSRLPLPILFLSNIFFLAVALLLRPAYPLQVHFSPKEIDANIRRKNYLLFLVLLIQCSSLAFFDGRVLAHSLCAVILCVIAVLLQKQKGRFNNEQT